MKKGRALILLNMATTVTQGPDSNTPNCVETEVDQSDDELIPQSQMRNINIRGGFPLISNNIEQHDLNECSAVDVTMIENKENLPSPNKNCTEVKMSELNYHCEERSAQLSPTPSDEDIFDSDDSVKDRDYVPPTNNKRHRYDSDISDTDSMESVIEYSQNIIIPASPEQEENNLLTKKGTIRKRKRYETSLKTRKESKMLIKRTEKYQVKKGCAESCRKKCSSYISEDRRKDINSVFRNMTWSEQKIFIKQNTSTTRPKRPKTGEKKLNREKTISYFLMDSAGTKFQVCKTFFLETLGFNRKNDKAVRNAINMKDGQVDKRGSNPNPKKINNENIIQHIESFHPTISHHRREHAPNLRYLSSDIKVRAMYNDYCESQDEQISYEYYRKVVKSLNISFAKLGHEECESCEKFMIHNPRTDLRHRNCEECKNYEIHHEKYILARAEYKRNVDEQNNMKEDSDTAYFAVDLQKVIMLPRMDQFKIVMFCPRLIVFNESFVPIGDKKITSNCQIFAALWHEATSGRKKEDILSCFRGFFLQNRDLKHIVLWLDNCAAQNKNWALLSYLLYLVNSVEVSFETITLKYLEVGHTFMAADEFHHRVEMAMKNKKRIYDFEDFCQAVLSTNYKYITIKKMNVEDFYNFEDCSSAYKLQNATPRVRLADICQITFRRGNQHVFFYKTNFDGDEHSLDFLRLKNIKNGIPLPKPKLTNRGITSERKMRIVKELGPLMPENRRVFWKNLPVNDNAIDLTKYYED